MRTRSFGLALGPLLLGMLAASPGHAQQPPPSPPPGVACRVQGRTLFDKDASLSDASGRLLARFSGGESAVTLLEAPADPSGRARIETGTGKGAFRIAGLIKPSELRVFTSTAVPVVVGHVWLGAGVRVTLAGAAGGKVRFEKQVSTPFDQKFSALADCSALTFAPRAAPAASIAGNARVYLMKVPLLDLYTDSPPDGSPITSLQRSALADNVRFFSTEQRRGFVHLVYHGEVLIDAWAKASDLQALPRGETSDVPPGSYTMTTPPELQLAKTPRVVTTSREVPLRVAAKEGESPIGVIEAETEVYVMDVMAGWAVVLPKSLHILPAGELQFWVKTSDLGI